MVEDTNVRVLTDSIWQYWSGPLKAKPTMTWIELFQICRYFLDESEKRGIDPQTVDLKAELDPLLSYGESKNKVASLLDQIAPPQPSATDLVRTELEKMVKDTEFRIVTEKDLDKLHKLERDAERLRERAKELEASRLREISAAKEEAERLRKELAEAPVIKLEILKDFREGIVDFYRGQVIETKNRGWALQKINQGLAKEVMPEVAVRKPRLLTPEEEKKLEDTFKAELQASLGRIPRDAMAEFRAELDKAKAKSFTDAQDDIVGLANEIAFREVHKPKKPFVEEIKPLRPEIPPEMGEVVGLPPEFITAPPKPLPSRPLNPAPFPRAPTSEEKEVLTENFSSRLRMRGFHERDYWKVFQERILNWPFRSWDELLKLYEELISDIIAGKELKLVPIPPMPWQPTRARQDAILHFISTEIYKTLQDLIDALSQWGVHGVTKDEVVEAVNEGKKRNDVWLRYLTPGYLEGIIGV